MSQSVFDVHPVGRVESPLVDRDLAPRQGDEGAPDAWLVFEGSVRQGIANITVGSEVIVLTWLDRAQRDVLAVHPRGDEHQPLTACSAPAPPTGPIRSVCTPSRCSTSTTCAFGCGIWKHSTAPRSWTSSPSWSRSVSGDSGR